MASRSIRRYGFLSVFLSFVIPFFATGAMGDEVTAGTYDVTRYGAVGDGTTLNTKAIQSAIDAAAGHGGGEVLIPPGSFLTGTLYMKSHVLLRLAHGAIVLGSTDLADYPVNCCAYASWSDQYTVRALIWGEGLEDIGITGTGTLDGQGAHFRGLEATPEQVAECSRGLESQGRYAVRARYLNRPYLIRLIGCRNVLVENVALRNSAMWMQHYLDCDFVTLRGLNVFNHVSPNNDMVDIDGCRNVLIANCIGDTDDDALTFKSTGPRATEHVVVTNCIVRSHCNAIKAGTESSGGFRDIAISNCVIQRSQAGDVGSGRKEGLAGIALELVDGGTLERVSISNVVIEGTAAPIFMRLGNRARRVRPDDPTPPAGVFRDVSISDVTATGAGVTGCAIAGVPGHRIENVVLSNIRIAFDGGGTRENATAQVPEQEDKYPESLMFGTLPAYGFYLRHVQGVRLRDVEFRYATPDQRPAVVVDDAADLHVDGLIAQAEQGVAQVLLRDVRHARVNGCGLSIAKEGACEDTD